MTKKEKLGFFIVFSYLLILLYNLESFYFCAHAKNVSFFVTGFAKKDVYHNDNDNISSIWIATY